MVMLPDERSGRAVAGAIVPAAEKVIVLASALLLASWRAARNVHVLPAVAQTPLIAASGWSPRLFTVKVGPAAAAGVREEPGPARKAATSAAASSALRKTGFRMVSPVMVVPPFSSGYSRVLPA
jgi:hypothetical protein